MQALTGSMDSATLALFPQLFVACLGALNTTYVHLFRLLMDLLIEASLLKAYRRTVCICLTDSMREERPTCIWKSHILASFIPRYVEEVEAVILQMLKRLDFNDTTVQMVMLACTPAPHDPPQQQVVIFSCPTFWKW